MLHDRIQCQPAVSTRDTDPKSLPEDTPQTKTSKQFYTLCTHKGLLYHPPEGTTIVRDVQEFGGVALEDE